MQLQDIHFAGQRLIEAYGDNGFRLTNGRFEGSILILPGTVEKFEPDHPAELEVAQFAPVFAACQNIEIMILRTGEQQKFPPIEITKAFIEHKIALEVMDSRAACRTYNILVSEDRLVAAALIAI